MLAQSTLHALTILTGYGIFCILVWQRWYVRSKPEISPVHGSLLVAYASQGGVAERIARQSAEGLQQISRPVTLLPLNRVDDQVLRQSERALFVVSTYGEGEPPDNGMQFARRYLGKRKANSLQGINCGVLALGDSRYVRFCEFGQQLHRGLIRQGARALFEPVTMDREDSSALRQWQDIIAQFGGNFEQAANDKGESDMVAMFDNWQLVMRRYLNGGSPGDPIYLLRLRPQGFTLEPDLWQAGDIAQILPGVDAPLTQMREYSIASIPKDGTLELVVRLHRHEDGTLGLGSGWLIRQLSMGASLKLRVRKNPSFHEPDRHQPMILIGNGTGIAGLRAHLKAREAQGATQNWLLFGERTRACDALFDIELQRWCNQGVLSRLDRTFSWDARHGRGDAAQIYVQDALRGAAQEICQWVERGACIYVCGSLPGMAADVDKALRTILGSGTIEDLLCAGHYRRDVY